MTTHDWITAALVFALLVVIAWTLGTRKARENEAAEAEEAGSRAKPARAKAQPREAGPEDDEPASQPQPPPKKTKEEKEAAIAEALARVDYEEDEDIDPTRVGVGASSEPRKIYQPPVKRIVYDEDAEPEEPTSAESFFLVSATAQTDKGLRRKRNEDSLLVKESAGLFVVADGMGGYRGGELASQLAVKTIADAFDKREFEGPPHDSLPRDATELARAMQMANAAILETAKAKRELEGMGTTLVAARFSPKKKRLFIGHVGDSRCYRLRDGVLKQMTADHTMADHGVTGPESAHLSRAIGIWPTVPMDVIIGVPQLADVYLLCSDGLTKMLPDDAISTILRAEEDPAAAVERLVFYANARGGKDNITIILVRVVPPGWKPRPSTLDPAELDASLETTFAKS